MPGYHGGILRGDQGPLPSLHVLGEAPVGGKYRMVLHRNLLQGERRDEGEPTVNHHLQCGGGRSGMSLGIPDGGRGWG